MFYHNIITQKSWQELTGLVKVCNFTLIGGWATYLYTKSLKSKDIDILIEYDQLGKLRKKYDLTKNERLKKYEAKKECVQIDIYLPHYSNIGIPVEELVKHTASLEGFSVLEKEWLIALKIYVLDLRIRTSKGEKDFLDILSLFQTDPDSVVVKNIIKNYKLQEQLGIFINLLNERDRATQINLNPHKYKKLKDQIVSSL